MLQYKLIDFVLLFFQVPNANMRAILSEGVLFSKATAKLRRQLHGSVTSQQCTSARKEACSTESTNQLSYDVQPQILGNLHLWSLFDTTVESYSVVDPELLVLMLRRN